MTDVVVNGITAGSVYTLAAIGMAVIFGVLQAINFAHGEYYTLGTFAAWCGIETMALPYVVSIPPALAAIAPAVGLSVMQRPIDAAFQIGVVATLDEVVPEVRTGGSARFTREQDGLGRRASGSGIRRGSGACSAGDVAGRVDRGAAGEEARHPAEA